MSYPLWLYEIEHDDQPVLPGPADATDVRPLEPPSWVVPRGGGVHPVDCYRRAWFLLWSRGDMTADDARRLLGEDAAMTMGHMARRSRGALSTQREWFNPTWPTTTGWRLEDRSAG